MGEKATAPMYNRRGNVGGRATSPMCDRRGSVCGRSTAPLSDKRGNVCGRAIAPMCCRWDSLVGHYGWWQLTNDSLHDCAYRLWCGHGSTC